LNLRVLRLTFHQVHIVALSAADSWIQVCWVWHIARPTLLWVQLIAKPKCIGSCMLLELRRLEFFNSSNKNINKKILTYHNQSFSSRCFFFLLWCFYSCTICLNNFFSYNKRYYKNFMNFFFWKNCIKKRIQLSCIIIQYQFKVSNLKCVSLILFLDNLISYN
jgi:hypothetical protein